MRDRKARRSRPPGKGTVDYIWERDGARCVYCGVDSNLMIDHVYPWVLGGKSIRANCVLACGRCNQRKGLGRWSEYAPKAFAHLMEKGEDLSWVEEVCR